MVAAAALRSSATALMSTVDQLAAVSRGGLIKQGTSPALRAEIADRLVSGAVAVESLHSPALARVASELFDQAVRVSDGTAQVSATIETALEGSRWLLGRSMYAT